VKADSVHQGVDEDADSGKVPYIFEDPEDDVEGYHKGHHHPQGDVKARGEKAKGGLYLRGGPDQDVAQDP